MSESTMELRDGKLWRELNDRLHEVSQPVTVLLCTLEYVGSLDSIEDIREITRVSQEACERLRKSVASMQVVLREAIESAVKQQVAAKESGG